jgi:glycosyltransferase involved in cell wall biosynthesis
MTASPWISVVIPTYQGERFLPQALESIAQQWDDTIEVIAIDDGSTDDTLEILEQYASRLALRVLAYEHTGNWVQNTNRALNVATGTYVCMLHQDDLWLPSRVASLRAAMKRHPNAEVYLNPSLFIDETGKTVGPWSIPLPTDSLLDSHEVLAHLIVQNFIALPAPVFRRDLWKTVDNMDVSLWFLADWKLWGALIAKSTTVVIPETLTAFRLHAASQTAGRTHDDNDLRIQYQTVIAAIAHNLEMGPIRDQAIRAAELNTEICIAMALWSHGARRDAVATFCRLREWRIGVWRKLTRDSRIRERTLARLRAGLHLRNSNRNRTS